MSQGIYHPQGCADRAGWLALWLRQAWRGFALGALLAVGLMGAVRAQDMTFKDEELDPMLTPIALYPDSPLSQILMASTCRKT